ncbi:MAG: hypothetical protein WD317_09965 [Balneolaceae bacterium]
MQKSFSDRFDSWIFDSFHVSPGGLALFRIFTALMILFFLMPAESLFVTLGGLPDDFYNPPPGPIMLFSSFPPASFLLGVHALLTGSLIALLLGFYTRWSSLLTGILMLVLKGFIFSIGKINHDLLISVVPVIFAFSSWGRVYSLDSWLSRNGETAGTGGDSPENDGAGTELQADVAQAEPEKKTEQEKEEKTESWPFSLLALFIGFMFFTAGFPKILGGWLNLSTQATRGHFFNQYLPKERTDLMAEAALGWDSMFFWEFLDIATIVFEVGFLLAIFHPRTTRLFICIAVVFHFSTMMIMNIAFLFNFIAYAAFLNWDWVNKKLETLLPHSGWYPFRGWIWGAGLGILFSAILAVSSQGVFIDQSDMISYEVIMLASAFVLAIYGLLSAVFRIGLFGKNPAESG